LTGAAKLRNENPHAEDEPGLGMALNAYPVQRDLTAFQRARSKRRHVDECVRSPGDLKHIETARHGDPGFGLTHRR